MRFLKQLAMLGAVLAVARFGLGFQIEHVEIPLPAWIPTSFSRAKPLQTMSLQEAQARVADSRGKPSVSVLYLTFLPSFLKDELADDVKRWHKSGAAVHAFSIDAVKSKTDIPGFARSLGKDMEPIWIQMPEGAACALKQLEAVTAMSGLPVNPQQTIPLITLVLRDASGNILKAKSVTVPNGQAFDLQELEHALAPFDVSVRRALR